MTAAGSHAPNPVPSSPRVVGRYLICNAIAAGGMATVHLGRLMGPEGFSRTVAIKQLHPQFAVDPEFVVMFLDEARVASRIHHPNVVSPLDVVMEGSDLFIVMDYVHGESLARLQNLTAETALPPHIAAAVISQTLLGLHAAHEACDETGQPLGIVHRDVSPQNIMLTDHGLVRVVDFGIAKAQNRGHRTEVGKLKGKLGYMSPEQLALEPLDRRADVFAAGIVLWEMLTGQRLFASESPAATVQQILKADIVAPSEINPALPRELDELVRTALARDPGQRFQTAHEMAVALAQVSDLASAIEVGAWVANAAGSDLRDRADRVADLEALSVKDLTRALPVAEFGITVTAERPPPVGDSLGPTETSAVTLAPHRPRKRWFAWALAPLLLTFGGTVLLVRAYSRRAENIALGVPAPLATGLLASSTALVAAAASSLLPVSTSDPELLPPPARTAPTKTPLATAKSKPAPKSSAALAPLAPEKSRRNCQVPYEIDDHGVKRFKEECF